MSTDRFMTVTQLTHYIKKMIDTDPVLHDVWVKGEISNFKLHTSGHMYFTLKDSSALIHAVMFASWNRNLRFKPEEGMKVLVRGEVSVYERRGLYQIQVKEMQPDGIGSLYLAFEKLKQKLSREGLFAREHKKSLPAFPTEIGVITSPTGAVLQDIRTTIKRRFPVARVTVFPCQVQGQSAAFTIVRAIKLANELNMHDVLIIARGGGSIEELWAFNEEAVARAIFASRIPIISAVGHETDFTIADFMADERAPTPTGAAELAVPSLRELQDRLDERRARLLKAAVERINRQEERLANLKKSFGLRYLVQLLREREQELDEQRERLQKRIEWTYQFKKGKWIQLYSNLWRRHPEGLLDKARERHTLALKALEKETRRRLAEKERAFGSLVSRLNNLSPFRTLERGYSLTYQDGELIDSVKQVQQGDNIEVQLKDGRLDCKVQGLKERTNRPFLAETTMSWRDSTTCLESRI